MFQIPLYILIGSFSSIFLFGFIYRKTSKVCKCKNQLTGKTVIVTGASAGIGKEAAYDFAERGARVILACRNLRKAEGVKDWIVSSTCNKNVICRQIELSDFESVRKFVKETIEKEKKIDVLVNNAGRFANERLLSKERYEMTLATNYYGPFLLTILLLDLIVKSAPSRIINVSSDGHKFAKLDLNDLHYKNRKYGMIKSYIQSKLCNVLFTNELARRLTQKGIENVTVNSLHPGAVRTELHEKGGALWMRVWEFIFKYSLKTAILGAQTIIHLAVSDEGGEVTGGYFVNCKIASTSEMAKDQILGKELWQITENQVRLSQNEKF